MTGDVLLETRGPIGVVTLNRPKALHALSLGMIRSLHPKLEAWAKSPDVKAVVIRASEGKAFCAGGDVRAVAESADPRAFFQEEYALNHLIHHFEKPFIALVDGICMGGGLGLSIHGSHRVVTERLLLAMPETGIGLFPDVGGGWFLPRFPGETGTWMGLTGARCGAADAMWLGYATHFVPHERMDDAWDRLVRADWSAGTAHDVADAVLSSASSDPGPAPTAALRKAIDRCFAGDTVEDILAALEAEGTEWASQTRSTLAGKCPFSLAVTLRQLRLGRSLGYDEMREVELRLALALTARPDFREGIRAVLVDKDNRPAWKPATLSEVRDEDVEACFRG